MNFTSTAAGPLPDGGALRLFRPLWWRTYRYLQLDVETGGEPLVLEDLRGLFTAYPFQLQATFDSDDPSLKQIWDIGCIQPGFVLMKPIWIALTTSSCSTSGTRGFSR